MAEDLDPPKKQRPKNRQVSAKPDLDAGAAGSDPGATDPAPDEESETQTSPLPETEDAVADADQGGGKEEPGEGTTKGPDETEGAKPGGFETLRFHRKKRWRR